MSSSSGSLSVGERLRARYEAAAVPVVEHEDRFTREAAQDVWDDIYQLFRASSEPAHDEVRLAVYAYAAVNGTSMVGKYSRNITSNGVTVAVNDVVKKIVGGTVREFFRADVVDAYYALKYSNALEEDAVFVAKAVEKGVPRGYVHCAVDFLRGCPEFTVEEKRYSDNAFKLSVARASNARDGKSLDDISAGERREKIEAGTSRERHVVDEF